MASVPAPATMNGCPLSQKTLRFRFSQACLRSWTMSGPTWETVGLARASRMRGMTGLGPGIRSSFSRAIGFLPCESPVHCDQSHARNQDGDSRPSALLIILDDSVGHAVEDDDEVAADREVFGQARFFR